MNVIFQIFKKFKTLAIILGLFCLSIILVGNLYYQLTKTDIYLVNELDNMLHSEKDNAMHVPLGWNVVEKTKLDHEETLKIEFSENSFLERTIIYYDTLEGVDYCITKTQEFVWSKFDVFFVLGAIIILLLFIVLVYFVIKMFIVSHTWKMFAILDNHLVEDIQLQNNFNDKILKKVNNSLESILEIEVLRSQFQKEFSAILFRIKEYSNQILEQKKVPAQYEQELRYLLSLI